MRYAAIVLIAMLAACERSEGAAAEAQYNIVAATRPSDLEEMCRRASAVREGYLRDQNERAYREWELKAMTPCIQAQTERQRAINNATR